MEIKESDDHWRPKPGIIDAEMIRNAIRKMIKSDVPGITLDEEEGYEFDQVAYLYLEHLDILKIDNLWLMPNLTILKLTGNLISKIENLECLVNLVDLNLSFNRIEVIENLGNLTELRHLSLFSNLITKLENLSHLNKLKIFTIGNNKIEEKESILHLRNMNIYSLNMAGNPCAKEAEFRFFVAAFIPKLEYYEYKLITDAERKTGRECNEIALDVLERDEATTLKEEKLSNERAEKEETYKQAFVEGLDKDQLYELMLESDPSSEALLLVGDEVVDILAKLKENISAATIEIFNLGLEKLKARDKEIALYHESTQEAILKNRDKQRHILEKFLESKSLMFVDIEEHLGEFNKNTSQDDIVLHGMDERVDKANLMCVSVKKELMTLELVLSEQLKEVFALFERSLGDMVNSFIEAAQGYFTTMREHETVFSEQLGDHVNRYLTQLTIRNEDLSTLAPALRPIMVDKESVNTTLAMSHDVHLQVIDNREDQLMSRCRNWYQKLCQDIEQEEILQFRNRIKEIFYFMELQVSEFQQYNVNVHEEVLGFDEQT